MELFLTPDGQGAERSHYWLNPISVVDLPGKGLVHRWAWNPVRTVRCKGTFWELLGKTSWGLPSTEVGSVKTGLEPCSVLGSRNRSTMRMKSLSQRKAQLRHTVKPNLGDFVSNAGSNHS